MTARPLHILVIDDDDDIRETLTDILRVEGYEVSAAADGAEAHRLLGAGQCPDLILLDLMMPVMDGFEFREEQLKHPDRCSIPVIVVTADGTARAKMELLHPAGFLTKPVKMRPLLETVRRVGTDKHNAESNR
jgi:CheY-like chemotaxis protein